MTGVEVEVDDEREEREDERILWERVHGSGSTWRAWVSRGEEVSHV